MPWAAAAARLDASLPWYFSLTILLVWLVSVYAMVRVGRHLLASRAERRRSQRGRYRWHPRALDRGAPPRLGRGDRVGDR